MVLVVAASAMLPKLLDWYDDRHPAAPAPADLCITVGVGLFERFVPAAQRDTSATYSSGSDARCAYRENSTAGTDEYGLLQVRLLRYGQIGWNSGADLAADAIDFGCESASIAGQFRDSTGLGDEACTAYTDEGEGGVAYGAAVIRRGADLIQIDYYRHPGSSGQALAAVNEVARALLAAQLPE
ncbi:hypothetical protein H0264_29310 [Nocardia huaxiensis]|uniref:Uncharacterized protein n=1 Tax=Nocardia huaxiensis TaxID=2755382 RepID=A0A7D6VA42_9NOCA|nr:hypothetical protein [Nocardia huaxiensis]QLY29342.1 hypothetical protein H0264_29310 [Nocardia huaxiensis]